MKILYDYQGFSGKYSGISKCFVELIANLPRETEFHVSIKDSENYHLLDKKICDVNTEISDMRNFISDKNFFLKRKLYKMYAKCFPSHTSDGRNKLYSVECLKKGDFDVFHPTYFNPYFLDYIGNKPFVITIHDMIPETFPDMFKHDWQVREKARLAKLAAHIVAVSECTKRDIVKFLNIPEEKISVIYHGAPEVVDYPKAPVFDFKYLLYVGVRSGYKNFQPMLSNIGGFLKQNDIKLVCTHCDFDKSEQMLIKQLGLENHVVHVFADDNELKNLYHNALAFVQPSLYEGFGIPILEAYQYDCPVFLNDKSVFPEIAKEAAVFFTLDESVHDLDSKLEMFLAYSDGQKRELIERQRNRLMDFSWKKSAEKLNDVYLSVAGR